MPTGSPFIQLLIIVSPRKASTVTEFVWKANIEKIVHKLTTQERHKNNIKLVYWHVASTQQWVLLPDKVTQAACGYTKRHVYTMILFHANNHPDKMRAGSVPHTLFYPVLTHINKHTTLLYPNIPVVDLHLSFKYYLQMIGKGAPWHNCVPHIPTALLDTTTICNWKTLTRNADDLMKPAQTISSLLMTQLLSATHNADIQINNEAVVLKVGGGWGGTQVAVVSQTGLHLAVCRLLLDTAWPTHFILQPLVVFKVELRVYYIGEQRQHWAVIGQKIPKVRDVPQHVQIVDGNKTTKVCAEELERLAKVSDGLCIPILRHFRRLNASKAMPLLRIDWLVLHDHSLVLNEVEGWGADVLNDPTGAVCDKVNDALLGLLVHRPKPVPEKKT